VYAYITHLLPLYFWHIPKLKLMLTEARTAHECVRNPPYSYLGG
jgi:hypothetical protein